MPTCKACGAEGTGYYCSACGVSYATGKRRRWLHWWVIAAIVLALVVGIRVAVVVTRDVRKARYVNNLKYSMGDIRTLADAFEAYGRDRKAYPVAEDWVDVGTLAQELGGYHPWLRRLRSQDGWRYPIQYRSDGTRFELRSLGKDGRADVPQPSGTTQRFDNDMIYQSDLSQERGSFTAWPEGFCN